MNWDIAFRYKTRGINQADAFFATLLGSAKALERYKPEFNCKPQTYMFWWSRQSTGRHTYDHHRLIREPVHKEELLNKINIFIRSFFNRNGKHPTIPEIAKHINISEKKVKKILNLRIQVFSLDKNINENENSSISELIMDNKISDSDPAVSFKREERVNLILSIIGELSNSTTQKIVKLRFGLNKESKRYSIDELSKKFNLPVKKIRQVLSNTIKQIKHKFRQNM